MFEIFAVLESVLNLPQNPYDIAHLNLGMLLHYLGKLEIQICCRYSADMEENAKNCILIASNLESFPILIACKNFSSQCSFTYLLLRSICGTENSSQQTSLQCLSTINMVLSDEDKILIKKFFAISMGQNSLF